MNLSSPWNAETIGFISKQHKVPRILLSSLPFENIEISIKMPAFRWHVDCTYTSRHFDPK
jgi:hypothetical protein